MHFSSITNQITNCRGRIESCSRGRFQEPHTFNLAAVQRRCGAERTWYSSILKEHSLLEGFGKHIKYGIPHKLQHKELSRYLENSKTERTTNTCASLTWDLLSLALSGNAARVDDQALTCIETCGDSDRPFIYLRSRLNLFIEAEFAKSKTSSS